MKHRALFLTLLVAAGLFLLTACTSSENEIAQDVRTESPEEAGSIEADGNDGAAAGPGVTQTDAPQDTGSDTGAQDASVEQMQTDMTEAGNAPSTETDAPEVSQTETSQEDDSGAPVVDDIWSGTYVSDQETVTISLIDAKNISFSFAVSGIAATAEVDGSTAVYKGDDHHVVVFEMNEGVLSITVSSEEDFDASASPLNGTYVRQTVTSDTGWGEEET